MPTSKPRTSTARRGRAAAKAPAKKTSTRAGKTTVPARRASKTPAPAERARKPTLPAKRVSKTPVPAKRVTKPTLVVLTPPATKPSRGGDADAANDAPAKAHKPPKPPRVRDSFALPEADYALIASLKLAARRNGLKAKKNELIRLGLRALDDLSPTELLDRLLTMRVHDKRSARNHDD